MNNPNFVITGDRPPTHPSSHHHTSDNKQLLANFHWLQQGSVHNKEEMAVQTTTSLRKQSTMIDAPNKSAKRKASEAFRMDGMNGVRKRPRHPRARGMVCFNEMTNKVYYQKYTYEDLERSWIQQSEYKEIKKDNKRTLIAIKKAGGKLTSLNVREHCIRGLEQCIATILFRVDKGQHRKIIRQVLSEQQEQRKWHISDPSSIRKVYAALSQPSLHRALHLGRIDAR